MVWCDVEREREREEEEEEEEEEDDDEEDDEEDDEDDEDEEMTVRKGAKRKRGHECGVCEKVFTAPSLLVTAYTRRETVRWMLREGFPSLNTCVFTRTRNRTNVMCARSVFVNLVL